MSHMLVADEAWVARRQSDGLVGSENCVRWVLWVEVFHGGFMMADFAKKVDRARVH